MKLNITIDEKTYEVEVEAAEPASPAPPAWNGVNLGSVPVRTVAPPPPPPTAAPSANEDKVCRSPVSGIVVRVAAQVGQTIQPGDLLLVLEAMKMETNITAPAAGKVAAIPLQQGDSVQAGQVVVEFAS